MSPEIAIPFIVFGTPVALVFIHKYFKFREKQLDAGTAHPKLLEAVRKEYESKQAELEALGWEALVVWQCETGDATALEKSLWTFLGPPSKSDRQSPEDRLALKKQDNNNQ